MSISHYIIIPFSLCFCGCQVASSLLEKTINPKTHSYTKSTKLLNQCNFNEAVELLQDNQNDFLKSAEMGLLYYYMQDAKNSNQYLDVAIDKYRDNEDKAVIDVSTLLRQAYQGEAYDKVFLHNYKAINYLQLSNTEASRVETRNSNIFQAEAYLNLKNFKKRDEKKYQGIRSRYEKLFQSVNPEHNPYQNPFAYYVSALSYEEDEDYANALIDIRKALQFMPNSKLLQNKLALYKKRQSSNSIELFFDVGQSPLKSQVQLEMDMGNGEKRMATLPSFTVTKSDIDHVKIVDKEGHVVAKSWLLTDINAIKINEFKEKLSSILYLVSKELALSVGIQSLNNQSQLLKGTVKAGLAIYGQQNRGTWSLLPQKILVASFQATNNTTYKLLIYSKENKLLNSYPLEISKNKLSKNTYKHFLLREKRICR